MMDQKLAVCLVQVRDYLMTTQLTAGLIIIAICCLLMIIVADHLEAN